MYAAYLSYAKVLAYRAAHYYLDKFSGKLRDENVTFFYFRACEASAFSLASCVDAHTWPYIHGHLSRMHAIYVGCTPSIYDARHLSMTHAIFV